MSPLVKQVSKHRLDGEPCPRDLEILITGCGALLQELGIEINGNEWWAPWADKSYLSEADYQNPDIAANVKAIDDTFRFIRFVALADSGEYIGYWCGPERRPAAKSPLVYYNSEGQFRLCGGRLVEAVFFVSTNEKALRKLRMTCASHGVQLNFKTIDDIAIPSTNVTPDKFHLERYAAYKGA